MQKTSTIASRKQALQEKLRELLQPSAERESIKVETFPELFDQLSSAANRELAIHLVDRNARLVREVEAALARLEDGTYGLCESCEEPIPIKRLDAMPWARLCVACQTRYEAQQAEEEKHSEAA
jgi:DnaK suppressor protein